MRRARNHSGRLLLVLLLAHCGQPLPLGSFGLFPIGIPSADSGADDDGGADGSVVVPDSGQDGGSDGGTWRWVVEELPGNVFAMNGRGTIALSITRAPKYFNEAYIRWPDGTLQSVDGPISDGGIRDTIPLLMTEDDCIFGQTRLFGDFPAARPFMWCPDAGMQALAADSQKNSLYEIFGVNQKHEVVGARNGSPFYWPTPDAGYALPTLSRPVGYARGINDSSTIVGLVQQDSGFVAPAVWTDGGTLILLTHYYSLHLSADAISTAGVVYGLAFGSAVAWERLDGQPRRLATNLSPQATAAISGLATGTVPLGYQDTGGRPYATVWEDGEPVLLETRLQVDAGWQLWSVVGVTNTRDMYAGRAVVFGQSTSFIAQRVSR